MRWQRFPQSQLSASSQVRMTTALMAPLVSLETWRACIPWPNVSFGIMLWITWDLCCQLTGNTFMRCTVCSQLANRCFSRGVHIGAGVVLTLHPTNRKVVLCSVIGGTHCLKQEAPNVKVFFMLISMPANFVIFSVLLFPRLSWSWTVFLEVPSVTIERSSAYDILILEGILPWLFSDQQVTNDVSNIMDKGHPCTTHTTA